VDTGGSIRVQGGGRMCCGEKEGGRKSDWGRIKWVGIWSQVGLGLVHMGQGGGKKRRKVKNMQDRGEVAKGKISD